MFARRRKGAGARARPTSVREQVDDADASQQSLILPTTTTHVAVSLSRKMHRRLHRRPLLRCVALVLVTVISVAWFLLFPPFEAIGFFFLPKIPHPPSHNQLVNNPGGNATIAIVSLHRGYKYHGHLGAWLVSNKESYAGFHGYSYFDERFPSSNLPPLGSPSSMNPMYYEKPRFLLNIMNSFPKFQVSVFRYMVKKELRREEISLGSSKPRWLFFDYTSNSGTFIR